MKKILKILFVLCIATCLVTTLVACGKNDQTTPDNNGEEESTVEYTVVVTCLDATVLSNVKVKLLNLDGSDATDEIAPQNGIVKFSLASGNYKVKLVNVPATYTEPTANLTATSTKATLKIALIEENDNTDKITYTVTVQKPDGTAVTGLTVQLCKDVCYTKSVNENGVATFELEPATYSVHLIGTIIGFTFDDDKYTVDADNNTITVTLDEE